MSMSRQFCSMIKTVEMRMDEQNQKRARSETQVGRKMALEEEKEREKGSKRMPVEKCQ